MTVKQIQHLLNYLEYKCSVDGKYGNETKTRLMEFQRDFKGLEVSGTPDTATCKALKHAVAYDMYKASSTGLVFEGIEHFAPAEFACKCGGKWCNGYPEHPSRVLVEVAERTRNHFGRPMFVTSGVRCSKHNAYVGGVSNSKHLTGNAVDCYVSDTSGKDLMNYLGEQPEVKYCYIITGNVVHFDV